MDLQLQIVNGLAEIAKAERDAVLNSLGRVDAAVQALGVAADRQ